MTLPTKKGFLFKEKGKQQLKTERGHRNYLKGRCIFTTERFFLKLLPSTANGMDKGNKEAQLLDFGHKHFEKKFPLESKHYKKQQQCDVRRVRDAGQEGKKASCRKPCAETPQRCALLGDAAVWRGRGKRVCKISHSGAQTYGKYSLCIPLLPTEGPRVGTPLPAFSYFQPGRALPMDTQIAGKRCQIFNSLRCRETCQDAANHPLCWGNALPCVQTRLKHQSFLRKT